MYTSLIFLSWCKQNLEVQHMSRRHVFIVVQNTYVGDGSGSSVGIATDYGLDGSGIESRWGRDFLYLSRPAVGPTQPPVQCVAGLSRG